MRRVVVVPCLALALFSAVATSAETTFFWDSVELISNERGGVRIAAETNSSSHLARLTLDVRGKSIELPLGCLPVGKPVLLNSLKLNYGLFTDRTPYWSLRIEIDHERSYNGMGRYTAVISDGNLIASYLTYFESDRVEVDEEPLCISQ